MSRSDDFLLTSEELRLRRQKWRRLIIGGISLLLLLVIVLLLARPSRHAIKAWQARRHAENAFRLIASESWADAQKEAVAGYQLAPNEPEATRAVARFLSRVRQPQALEFWDRLAKLQPLTRDDLRDEASVALALGETQRAATAIKALLAHDGHDARPGDWLFAAQLDAERGAPNESVEALGHVFASATANARERLQAAVFELRVSGSASEQDQKNQADAWQWIEKLAQGKDAVSLDALVLLAQRALANQRAEDGGQRSAIELATALEKHPLAKAPQRLLAIDLRMHASPNEKTAFIQAAIDRWKEADGESLVALATWLNGHGEYQRELDTIPLERARQSRELFLQHVDALGALGQWEEIRRLLNSGGFSLDPVIEQMYLARCYAQLEQKTASENSWQRALEAAGSDAGKLITLADYAEKNGAVAIAATSYDAAIASAPKLRTAWQGKLRLVQSARETKQIHNVLAEMLKIWPNDPAIQNDEAYTRLLLLGGTTAVSSEDVNASAPVTPLAAAEPEIGMSKSEKKSSSSAPSTLNPPQAGQLSTLETLARDLVRRESASLPHRTLLALVYLKQGRPATALGVYDNLHVPPNALTPSALAVHAAVLQANGNMEDATKEAAQVPRNALLPEEAALLGGLPEI